MCDPLTIMTGASLAISAVGAMGQMQAANQQYAVQQQQQALNIQHAKQSRDMEIQHVTEQVIENEATDKIDLHEKALEVRKAKSRAAAASAEAGVAGLSVDALMQDYDAGMARYRDAVNLTAQNRRNAAQREMAGANLQFQQRVTGFEPQKPSMLEPLVNFGSAAISAYDKVETRRAANPKTKVK